MDLLRSRRSIRRYVPTSLSPDKVADLLKAPLMAPSSKRCTPWEFIVVDDAEMLEKLSHARPKESAFVASANLAVVVTADTELTDTWIEDASIASTFLQLQAEDLGLGSCWTQVRNRCTAEGEDSQAYVRRLLDIPEKYGVLNIIAVGMKGEEKKTFDESRLKWEKIHPDKF